MQALIVDDNIARQTELTIALMETGFQVTATTSHAVADSCIRRGWIDVLVMDERVCGRLTHSLALLAEWRNAMSSCILMTSRTSEEIEELFLLIPSLHCLLAPDIDPVRVASIAVASVSGARRGAAPMMLTKAHRVAEMVDEMPIFASSRRAIAAPPLLRRTA